MGNVKSTGMIVLLVDDDREIRMALAHGLVDLGYGVCQATDGRDALRLLSDKGLRPALILSDFSMPNMDGAELCRACKRSPELRTIPFLLSSGDPDADHMARSLGVPFHPKYGRPQDLLDLVAQMAGRPDGSGDGSV